MTCCIGRLGPVGLGAEQIAPTTSLLYPGQFDFSLQAAWPNAWESMSTLADALMLFLDFRPDAPNNRFTIAPKLPTGWSTITFNNVRVGAKAFNVTCSESASESREVFTNVTAGALGFDTTIRIPAGLPPTSVTRDGAPIDFTYTPATGQVRVTGTLNSALGATTTLVVTFGSYPTISPHDVKTLPDGAAARLDGAVVTRVHADRFNVETSDRSAGVAVMGAGAQLGKQVELLGTIDASGPERVFVLASIVNQSDAPSTPAPLGMTNKSADAADPDSIGLDIRLWGRITRIAPDDSYMTIDDGSGLPSSAGATGIKLTGDLNASRFTEGGFISATGSLSAERVGATDYRVLRVSSPVDVQ